MKAKVQKALISAKQKYPELKHITFKIKKKNIKQAKITPTIKAYFQKKHKRQYKIIIPENKKHPIYESEKEIEKWVKNELAFVLESQTLPAIQLLGFTLQYIINKKFSKN